MGVSNGTTTLENNLVLCVQVRHTDTETQKPFLKAATLEKLWNIHSRMFMAALRKMKKKKPGNGPSVHWEGRDHG